MDHIPNPLPRAPRWFWAVLAGFFASGKHPLPQNLIPKQNPRKIPTPTGHYTTFRERERTRRVIAGDGGGDDLPDPAGELHVPLQPPHRARRTCQLHHRPERKYASQTLTLVPLPIYRGASWRMMHFSSPTTRRRRREERHPHGPLRRLWLPR